MEVSLPEGPLGLTVDHSLVVARVNPGSNAEKAGVCVNWSLIAVNGQSVVSMAHDDALQLIRSSSRPVSLTFKPNDAPASSEEAASAVGVPSPVPEASRPVPPPPAPDVRSPTLHTVV